MDMQGPDIACTPASLLPEVDALSKADTAGPTFRLGSPELLKAAATRTEEMLRSKFLT